MDYKIIIEIQCNQVKYMSRLFAKNLNNFNKHSFGQTVYYSVSPSLSVPFDSLRDEELPQFQVVPHFLSFSEIS